MRPVGYGPTTLPLVIRVCLSHFLPLRYKTTLRIFEILAVIGFWIVEGNCERDIDSDGMV
jgi:hypothetical protein